MKKKKKWNYKCICLRLTIWTEHEFHVFYLFCFAILFWISHQRRLIQKWNGKKNETKITVGHNIFGFTIALPLHYLHWSAINYIQNHRTQTSSMTTKCTTITPNRKQRSRKQKINSSAKMIFIIINRRQQTAHRAHTHWHSIFMPNSR